MGGWPLSRPLSIHARVNRSHPVNPWNRVQTSFGLPSCIEHALVTVFNAVSPTSNHRFDPLVVETVSAVVRALACRLTATR